MNLFLPGILIGLVLLGALIAWLGDVIGYRLGNFQTDVADSHQVCFGNEPGYIPGVNAPHASRSDHSYFNFSHFVLYASPSHGDGEGGWGPNN